MPKRTKKDLDIHYGYQPGDVVTSLCIYCTHLKRGAVCAAFPSGIPETILYAETDHIEPIPGDNDIQFEQRKGLSVPDNIKARLKK